LKWLVAGPLIFHVTAISIILSLGLHHIAIARGLQRVLSPVLDGPALHLHLVAIVTFFGVLGYKTFTASGRDARRRLLLIDIAGGRSFFGCTS
jgi:hypothetical protein